MADIWLDPVETESEGVQADQPAETPSEVVKEPWTDTATAESTAADGEATDEAASETAASEQATADVHGETSPETPDVKREARRVFMETQRLGGFDALKEAYDLQTTIQDQSTDAKAKLDALYHAAPRAFEDLQKELFFSYWDNPAQQDALDRERYGATSAEIKEALAARGQFATSPDTDDTEERYDPLTDEYIPEAVKTELRELRELKSQVPELRSTVSTFAERQEADRAKQVTELGGEFVKEAVSPVIRMMEEAGLKVLPDDSPAEKEWKEEVWDTILHKSYQKVVAEPVAQDVETFLTKLDRAGAWGKMRVIQAKAEMAASKLIPIYTAHRQQERERQTSVLGKDRPKVIQGGQTSFGSKAELPSGRSVWDDPNEQERWRDIAANST